MNKKFLVLMWTFIVFLLTGTAQVQKTVITENFDGQTVSFTSTPAQGWAATTDYYVSPSKAYWGIVPNLSGEEVVLETPPYDLTNYPHVYLQFKHICKISPLDTMLIMYKLASSSWQPLPVSTYQGSAAQYQMYGFNAASYTEWQVDDSTALPEQSWWRNEKFDLSFEVGYDHQVQFRFIIRKGNVSGTQLSYGWLLDDVEVIGTSIQITPPTVEFIPPYPRGTVYSAGHYTVNARVKTNSSAPIIPPYLWYRTSQNSVFTIDSIAMTAYAGDSLWRAVLPQFVVGTEVIYSIEGKDTAGNNAVKMEGYTINYSPSLTYDSNAATITDLVSPAPRTAVGGVSNPIEVVLRNKGTHNLLSATIGWAINGTLQSAVNWNGNLPWDFITTVNLGNYTPRAGNFDTITVWITHSNGVVVNPTAYDTAIFCPYGAAATFSGIYTVGSGSPDFTTWEQFKRLLDNTPPTGDITLEFLSHTHNANIDLTNFIHLMNGYKLTLTSQTGNANDATILPVDNTGIVFNNSNNIVVKALTIDVSTPAENAYGIDFTGVCNNVLIRDCRILVNQTTANNTVAAIRKGANTGMVDSIFFINNLLDGGYYGIQFYGHDISLHGTNIVFDSNIIANTRRYGADFFYADFKSVAHNTVSSRTANTEANWTGLSFNQCNSDVVGNRIYQKSAAINLPCGMYLSIHNSSFGQNKALIANNEIAVSTTGSGVGMQIASTDAKILHNSILVDGAGAGRGMYLVSGTGNLEIKYNSVVANGSAAHPIYLTNPTLWDIDYNNLFAPQFVGYANTNCTGIADWQSIVTSDTRSFSISPSFIDPSQSLELNNYDGFITLPHADVSTDINGLNRSVITNIGCYHGILNNTDAVLMEICNLRHGIVAGQSDILKVVIFNGGVNTIEDMEIHWKVNGVAQTPVSWSGHLTTGNRDTVTLGTWTYLPDSLNIQIYIDNLGTLTDDYKNNDTLTAEEYICSAPLNGNYTIGATGNFKTIRKAIAGIISCSANGNINLIIGSGTYDEQVDLSNISNYMNGHRLTLTSQTGVAQDVTIRNAVVGIMFNNSNHIVIKDITIDISAATNNVFGIDFTGSCTDVLIRDCHIKANLTSGLINAACINKQTNTGIVDSISFINNILDGAYHGIRFYGSDDTAAYSTNIVFDSNTITNSHRYGMYFYYVDFNSVAHNTVLSKSNVTAWNGFYFSDCNSNILANRVYQRNSGGTSVYLSNHNRRNTQNIAMIANNEVITKANNIGIHLSASQAKVLYNSIYSAATATGRGLVIDSNMGVLEVKYNNIVMEENNPVPPSAAYPIYLAGINFQSQWDVDYNNFYAPAFVGYAAGGNRATMSNWQSVVTTDTRSVQVFPSFANPMVDLDLSDYRPFTLQTGLHSAVGDVPTDIKGTNRTNTTIMGCYHFSDKSPDAVLLEVIGWRSGGIAGETDILKAVVLNGGQTPLNAVSIDWSINSAPKTQVNKNGNIPAGGVDTITLGTINYFVGNLDIKVFISGIGGLTDKDFTNDTIEINEYICTVPLNGIYTIGTDFTSFANALSRLKTCGVTGNVTLAFETDNYTENIDLTHISDYMNGYKLTITSQSDNASDVVIQATGSGIKLNNSHNILIKALTIDVSAGTSNTYGIHLIGACSNVVVRDCHILSNPTTTNNTVISVYKAAEETFVRKTSDSIFFINNLLEGGHTGFHFYPNTIATVAYPSTNMFFDSNTITNVYRYGIDTRSAEFESISHNTILSKQSGSVSAAWQGIASQRGRGGEILGNHIRTRSNNITEPAGIGLLTHEDTVEIVNNEIILRMSSASNNCFGVQFANSFAVKIWNNSIYSSGTEGKGIFIMNNPYMEVKYNNIVLLGNNAHPVYISGTSGRILWDIDYNNLYAPTFVGFLNYGLYMTDWQSFIPSDRNSFRILPSFIDNTTNLKQSSYVGFFAASIPQVQTDINGLARSGLTTIGCHHAANTHNVDALLTNILNSYKPALVGQSDTIRVVIVNNGQTPLTNMTINWSIDDLPQTSQNWTNNLLPGSADTVILGIINHALAGEISIKAYISGLTDDDLTNDTLTRNIRVCSYLNGTYTVGISQDYTTIGEALEAIQGCGVGGDVVLALKTGNYAERINLSHISDFMNGYTLTITSQSGNANDVTLLVPDGTVITLNNSHNIVIKAISIEITMAVNQRYGINFLGSCSNVLVRDCRILLNSTTTNQGAAISKAANTGMVHNVSFINNVLDGGYYGIYFYAGTGNTALGTNIVFDSNTVMNANSHNVLFYYADLSSVTGNTILSRSATASANNWRGMLFNSCNGDIIANKVEQRHASPTTPYGIDISFHNAYLTQNHGVIANNEVIMKAAGIGVGINVGNNNVKVLYNSVHVTGAGAARGMQIGVGARAIEVKYNNLVMTGNNAYPIYLSGTSSQWDIDYNNLHAPQFVGFVTGIGNRTDISAWQSTITTDKHSVKVLPTFINVGTSLRMQNKDSLLCPLHAAVNKDIEGKYRFSTTQIGAYTLTYHPFDMALTTIVNTKAILNETFTVEVEAFNSGLADIDTALLKWSKDGVYQGSFLWIAAPQMSSGESRNIAVGSFAFDGNPTEIKVWIDSINNKLDTLNWNDTVKAVITQAPLAWFTHPLVADTISGREFDVYAVIVEGSGALHVQPTPKLYLQTVINSQIFYDTLLMMFSDGKWSAHIPPRYYNSKVIYSLHVSDTVNNQLTIVDSTFIRFGRGSNAYTFKNLTLARLHGLNFGNTDCLPDYTNLAVEVVNSGNQTIHFPQENLFISLRVTQPIVFSLDTVIYVASLPSGNSLTIDLTHSFPIIIAGMYDITVSATLSGDQIPYDDTLLYDYVSGRFGLPIDEDFSDGTMDVVFNSTAEVGNALWQVISQGSGADADVMPQFGDGVLAFNGSIGSITKLYTRQLDLSQTVSPNLSFWYFHDTAPSLDYMDARVTIDGGATYTTLISLRKQDEDRGWKQYSMDLPAFAINQCVFIVFEAMEKDRTGQKWQYLDRIRITAKQDLAITNIYTDTTACDMDNKDWKVVLSNLTDPAIDYSATPVKLTLEVYPTGQTLTKVVNSGVLNGFSSDTITIQAGTNLTRETYHLTAYFESILDDNRDNDTLYSTFEVNPHLHVTAQAQSDGMNCLIPASSMPQTITIRNDGNMVMEDIVVTLEVHGSQSMLEVMYDTVFAVLHPNDSIVCTLTYTVPAEENFMVNIFATLLCGKDYSDSVVLLECVDLNNLRLVGFENLPTPPDPVGTVLPLAVRLRNNSSYMDFSNITIRAFVHDGTSNVYSETSSISLIEAGEDHVQTFPNFVVPSVSSYNIIVYIDTKDNAPDDDTLRAVRQTSNNIVGLVGEGMSMSQNIPNPAYGSTKVNYRIPADGVVVFKVYTVTGQTLITKSIESVSGMGSVDFDIATLAAGIYYYSMTFNGQTLVKKMNVQK